MKSSDTSKERTQFIDHVRELRRRALACAALVAIGTGAGYYINALLIQLIQQPLGEKLYFTSPTGGFNFIFVLCLAFGVLVSLPFIFYQILAFLHPVLSYTHRAMRFWYPACSTVLATVGVSFAYFISLPLALHFLTSIGSGTNIESLITTDAYFRFALTYLIGFAILFQLPLLLIIANRMTPLKPSKLMKAQKYVILGSFVLAAVLTPTPDPLNQLLMAGPIIVLYQVSVALIWIANIRRNKRARRVLVHMANAETLENPILALTPSIQTNNPATPVPSKAPISLATKKFISDVHMTSPSRVVTSRASTNVVVPTRNNISENSSRAVRTQISGKIMDINVSPRRSIPTAYTT